MAVFECWDPDEWGDNQEVETEIEPAYSAKEAAEGWAATRFSHDDYPMHREVCVRDAEGRVTRWEVTTETVPEFHARQRKEPDHE